MTEVRPYIPAGMNTSWYDKPVPRNVADPEAFRAARGFEAQFAQYMIKQMQGSVSMIGGEGFGAEVYNSMFTDVLGDEVAGQGGLGITDMIYRQLMQQKGMDPYKPEDADDPAVLPGSDRTPPGELVSGANRVPARAQLLEFARQAANRHGVNPRLVESVIRAESSWNPTAVSRAGALGLMQLMPDTANSLGVTNPFDPEQNIDGGVRYLKQMLERYDQDLPRALAAYNAGPGAVEKYGGIPPYEETRDYIRKIISWLAATEMGEKLLRRGNANDVARRFLENEQRQSPDVGATAGVGTWNPN